MADSLNEFSIGRTQRPRLSEIASRNHHGPLEKVQRRDNSYAAAKFSAVCQTDRASFPVVSETGERVFAGLAEPGVNKLGFDESFTLQEQNRCALAAKDHIKFLIVRIARIDDIVRCIAVRALINIAVPFPIVRWGNLPSVVIPFRAHRLPFDCQQDSGRQRSLAW